MQNTMTKYHKEASCIAKTIAPQTFRLPLSDKSSHQFCYTEKVCHLGHLCGMTMWTKPGLQENCHHLH